MLELELCVGLLWCLIPNERLGDGERSRFEQSVSKSRARVSNGRLPRLPSANHHKAREREGGGGTGGRGRGKGRQKTYKKVLTTKHATVIIATLWTDTPK